MPDCDYCGESFADEDAYLDHLGTAHEGDLGSIDRRRVAQHQGDSGGGFPLGPVLLVGLFAFAGVVVVYLTFVMGGGGGGSAAGLPDSGDSAVISQVQDEPSTGNNHVPRGEDLSYDRVPPTSGPHYSAQYTVDAGFYGSTRPFGRLLHSLEHGAVVVYYDPANLTTAAEQSMRGFASNHTGNWQSFIAVPNPKDDPEATYVLTAWTKRLTMDTYDADTVRAFMAEYIGRGPERTVR